MSFMGKIKDFFYDEEEFEEEEPAPKKERKKEKKAEKSFNIYDIEKAKNRQTRTKIEREEKQEAKTTKKEPEQISEKKLFKVEKTFNFPMDMDDEEDFQPIKKETPRQKVTKPRQNRSKSRPSTFGFSSTTTQKTKEESHFKPTPVISPIYGIMNNDEYKQQVIEDNTKTKEFSFDKKVDFDTIRKKAYKTLDDELEKTLNDTNIFSKIINKEKAIDSVKEEYEEKPYKKDEVVITYDEVDEEKEEKREAKEIELEEKDEIEVPKITRSKRHKKVEIEEEKENEDQDQDLFKIIDNMYKDDMDEEEDE